MISFSGLWALTYLRAFVGSSAQQKTFNEVSKSTPKRVMFCNSLALLFICTFHKSVCFYLLLVFVC